MTVWEFDGVGDNSPAASRHPLKRGTTPPAFGHPLDCFVPRNDVGDAYREQPEAARSDGPTDGDS